MSTYRTRRCTAFRSSTKGAFLRSWGEQGGDAGQLNGPAGIAFDADENIYVVDSLNHRVQKFTKEGQYLLGWGSYGAARAVQHAVGHCRG
ncbi:MAG: hypothetical protein R2911_35850 [Caldilineaceae bacterium]